MSSYLDPYPPGAAHDPRAPYNDDGALDEMIERLRDDDDDRDEASWDAAANLIRPGIDRWAEACAVLADLHDVHPADIAGSYILPRLYAVAKSCHAAREQALEKMASSMLEAAA